MSDLIRVLSAIKGQQNYYKHDTKIIDSEGIVLTTRNAETAVKALEKQIPKKPKEVKERHNFRLETIYKDGSCPMCNNDIRSTHRFCENCGQAIDWGNEDE